MKLKRLEIFGFKSFAKKLDVQLEGGITAVVGPNGCGKTNVVDAIRWVLGEQRPTQIRLERMEDVIFKGSDSRRPLGMAEVSLTIDNDAGRLPLALPEITITRRLFRTGESDYLINKKACRLSDINDLFMDTGMGTDSYSMFEQNMINSILSDKTEDRRHIFEEAAGVTKYKARRRSAIIKLSSIEDDLERVGDIISELDRHVGALKRQALKAERYRNLKTELRERTIAVAAHEIRQLKSTGEKAGHALKTVQAQAESIKAKSAKLTADNEQIATEMLNVEKEIEETAGRFNQNLTGINDHEKELARLGSQLEYLAQKVEHTRIETKRASADLEKLAEQHGLTAMELTQVTNRLDKVDKTSQELIERHRVFENRVREKSEEYSVLEKEYRGIEREQAEHRASLETVQIWGRSGETRLKEIMERTGTLNHTIYESENELECIENETKRAVEKQQVTLAAIHTMKEALDKKVHEYEDIDINIRTLHEEEATLKAEHDFLAEIVRNYDGYSDGVRNAVSAENLKNKVLGVLGDIIATDDIYVKAIETALADRLHNILVDSEETAIAGVQYLSEETRGRATFLPVNDSDKISQDISITGTKGVIGNAADLIRTDQRFKAVVGQLLANVFVVDVLDTAVELHHRIPNTAFVTLAGEKIGPMGDYHGGKIREKENKSQIGRLERLQRLHGAITEISSKIETYVIKRETYAKEADYLRSSIKEKGQVLEVAGDEIQNLRSKEAQISAKKSSAAEMRSNIIAEAERIQESFKGYENEIETLKHSIAIQGDELQKHEKHLQEAATELNNLKTELEARRSEVNQYTVERAALFEKKASLNREIATIRDRREALAQSKNRMIEEIERTEQESLEVGRNKSVLLEKLEKLSSKHEQIKAQKDETDRRHSELQSQRSEIERELQNLRRELVEYSQKESGYTLEREQASMRINSIIERLEDEYFVNREDIILPENLRDFDSNQEKLLLEDLRRKIFSIGDVNLAAEADYQEEKKRFDFLQGERDDLDDAKKTLSETIKKINNIARQRFLETFEEIKINFRRCFDDFFDGGICDLELEQEEDPLEAKILITARPPGKNVRSINLLSSGERALTAISLLFAIYQVKPSPFCILDEVDAPLDDANIDRYLQVIRRFSESTQFIMVTHNKKTMASADNLYGITMEEPGLSSLVSVRLSQVDNFDKKTGPELKGKSADTTVNKLQEHQI